VAQHIYIRCSLLIIDRSTSSSSSFLLGASVGAFVASTNVTCTRFYSRVIYNRTAQELMDGLQQCMRGKKILGEGKKKKSNVLYT
jgi:hypothetical protein